MRKLLATFVLGLLMSATMAGQIHTFPALDTNNVFTGTNTFNGPTIFPGGIPLVLVGDGTVGSPSIAFASSPSTGMWWDSGNTRITFSNQGVSVLDLAPTISTFRSNAIGLGAPRDTSITRTAAGVLTADTGTPGNALGVWNAAQFLAGDGSKTAPVFGFTGSAGLGWYRFPATADIVFAASSLNSLLLAGGLVRQGSAGFLGWASNSDPTVATSDTGLWRSAANTLSVSSSETPNSNGAIKAGGFVDNSASPASTGALRIGNNLNAVVGRNAANTGDIPMLTLLAGNQVTLGGFGSPQIIWINGSVRMPNGSPLTWATTTIGTADTSGISQTAAAILAVGNGTNGDTSGEFDARTFGITGATSGKGTLTVDATATKLTSSTPLNATTGFQIGGAATTNQALIGNGTNFVSTALTLASAQFVNQGTTTTLLHGNAAGNPSFGAVVSSDLNITPTTCTNQFLTAISATGVGTCTTDTLASAQHANQGTTTTVLHGNAAGNPAFAVITPSDAAGNTNGSGNFALTTSPVFVTPTLGVATATAVVSATASPAAAGVIRLANADTINFRNNAGSGDLTIAKTQATSGLVLADTLNIASFAGLFMAGPIWGTSSIAVDTTHPISIPAVTDTMAVLAATQTFTSKRVTPRVVTLATTTTFTPDGDNSDLTQMNMTGVAGTLTIAAPTGTPTEAQKLILRIKTTNAQTYSFNATYRFSTTTVAPTATGAAKTDLIGLIWNATDSKWDVVAVDQAH